MSAYNDRELGHAPESDGIEEFDNPLPDWWLGMFFVTIIWAAGYAAWYHVWEQTSQAQLYEEELAWAKERWPDLDKEVGMDTSEATLAEGREIYQANCLSCHGPDLRGGIGVNLVDTEWIHGGEFEDVRGTITEGVAAKGMPAWGPVLGPKKVAAVASFVLSENTGEAPAEPSADDAVAEATPDGEVSGEAVWTKNCVACHAADGTGGIGPSLVDEEWIHGGSLDDIRRTITEGVPAKGMITWKGVITDAEIEAVARFVHERAPQP